MRPPSKQTGEAGLRPGLLPPSQYGALGRPRRTWRQQPTARPERGGTDSCTHASFFWGSRTHAEDSCCSSLQASKDFPRPVSTSVLLSCGSQQDVEVALLWHERTSAGRTPSS